MGLFVPKGTEVVRTRGADPKDVKIYKTTRAPIVDSSMPVAVLIDGATASASEIVAGALQDLDRAVILGTRTYGKGLAQISLDLPYNGQLKLTTNKYYIPSGRCIQAINYKHARGGYMEHVPDSLTRVFHTRNGREVRDGGGIMPDVEVAADSLPNIAYYLAAARDSNEVLLNYEVDYIAKHPTVAAPSEFALSDADYDEFKKRVIDSGFTYDRESEKYVKELEKLAKFEGYYDDAKPEFDALKNKLNHNVAKDLDYNKESIRQIIESDLMTAYYYQRGSIENSLRYDKQMKEAVKIILDPERYHRLLRPAKP